MKMLGFMIAMTLVYWFFASFAQSIILSPRPCAVSTDIASVNGEPALAADEAASSTAVKQRARWSDGDAYPMMEAAAPSCSG